MGFSCRFLRAESRALERCQRASYGQKLTYLRRALWVLGLGGSCNEVVFGGANLGMMLSFVGELDIF